VNIYKPTIIATLVLLVFWLAGGVHWLNTRVFPPVKPAYMPANSIWIEGLALPISWHHGWWLGCSPRPDQTTYKCTLVSGRGEVVSDGAYVRCGGTPGDVDKSTEIVPPVELPKMWVANPKGELIPVAFLRDGGLLVPIDLPQTCEELKK
jgi:hypothetical protein